MTRHYPTHVGVICENCEKHGKCGGIEDCQKVLRERLAAYEDTGLTPEEIMKLIAPPNDPLSLEQVKGLNWEPIWVKRFNGAQGYYIAENVGSGLDLYRGGCGYESFSDYGKNWFAYRRKPEEGAK